MENKYTQKAQNALTQSINAAQELGNTYIGSEHLLIGLLSERDSVAARMLGKRAITLQKIKTELYPISHGAERTQLSARDVSPRLRRIIENAAELCDQNKQELVGSEHLLYSLLCESDCPAVRLLEQSGIYVHEIKNDVLAFITTSQKAKKASDQKQKDEKNPMEGFGVDLVSLAKAGKTDPTLCREKETERVIQILLRRSKNNPCLIGEPGVGKTAVVEGLAARIAEGRVPASLQDKIIFALDIPSLIAGAKYRGEFEERIKKIMRECTKNPDLILFIDEIHTIIGAGSAEGAIDAANILKPALSRGEIQIIGATTVAEYRKHLEKDAALERRFQPVRVNEPSADETERILYGLKPRYEEHHGIIITDEAIKGAVALSQKYICDRYLPDKAIDVIDEASSRVKLRSSAEPNERKMLEREILGLCIEQENAIDKKKSKGAKAIGKRIRELEKQVESITESSDVNTAIPTVTYGDVAETVRDWTGIPISKLLEGEGEKLLCLEDELKKRIIGQDKAISAVVKAIKRARLGLKNAEQPTGTFLFVGPSGVGKTELCLCLAELLFTSRSSLIRFDMSEFMEKHSISGLIGAPPGYVGYGEGGMLTEKVKRNPYSIILFDEIEKAHPDVTNILLQILEDGALTDAQGRRVSFKETVIIMTSNLGASSESEKSALGFFNNEDEGFRAKEREKRIKKALESAFKPEFINRIDEIVIFNELSKEDMKKICQRQLSRLAERTDTLGIEMEFDESVSQMIAENAFDKKSGARSIRREIRRLVENPLSEKMLIGEVKEGCKILVSSQNGSLAFVNRLAENISQ